jgi:hypothetical protein
MFEPMEVPTADVGDTWTFFLEATNREVELDEVALSMVIWGGQQSIGEIIPVSEGGTGLPPIPKPEDPWQDDDRNTTTPIFVPNLNSFRFDRKTWDGATYTDTRWAFSRTNDDQHNVVNNSWTIATWFRPKSTHAKLMFLNDVTKSPSDPGDPYYTGDEAWEIGELNVYTRESYTDDHDKAHNKIRIRLYGTYNDLAGGRYFHHLSVQVWGDNGSEDSPPRGNGISCNFRSRQFNNDRGQSGLIPYGILTSGSPWSLKNYAWMFLVVCFDGGPAIPGGDAENGDIPKIRVYLNNRSPDPSNPLDRSTVQPGNAMTCLNQNIPDKTTQFVDQENPHLLITEECNQNKANAFWETPGLGVVASLEDLGVYKGADTQAASWATMEMYQQGFWNVALDSWNGKGYYNKLGSRGGVSTISGAVRDSNPAWIPETGSPFTLNPGHTDGRANSLTAIHYLYNMGYGSDIDWTQNSNVMASGVQEYPFAENLVHCWQWGALPADAFTVGGEALRDSGSFVDGGDISFNKAITPVQAGKSSNSWGSNVTVADIISPRTLTNGGGAGFDEPEGTIAADGTTMSQYAFPGQGFRGAGTQYGGKDVNRPDTTNGVLDEPKTYNHGSATRDGQYP